MCAKQSQLAGVFWSMKAGRFAGYAATELPATNYTTAADARRAQAARATGADHGQDAAQ